jgi:hypothetical protein
MTLSRIESPELAWRQIVQSAPLVELKRQLAIIVSTKLHHPIPGGFTLGEPNAQRKNTTRTQRTN